MNKLSLYIIVVILSIGRLYPESTFSQNNIANAIDEFLNENLDKNCKYEILGNIESVKYNLPDVTASISSRNDKFEGLINLQITFKSNERSLKVMDIPVKIKKYIELPFAKKNIPKGSYIDIEDFDTKLIEQDSYNSNIENDISMYIGKKTIRNIAKGTLLRQNFIENESIIKKGDRITLVVQSGAVSIRTAANALEDGSEGQLIKILRESTTKKILQGVVQSDATVLLNGNNNMQGYLNVKNK